MLYTDKVITNIIQRTPNETEFHQAITETLMPIKSIIEESKIYQELSILERIIEPDREIKFRVTWRDDAGKIHVNRGYRVQFNGALGPYKGGLRFHPSVDIGIIKFLGFEQTFKNALTGLPLGGAKGGSDFDPKGKSDFEIMNFCQSFMNELFRHIGASTDVPAGDIGVGAREIGYLYGQYKKIKNIHEGVLTGKGLEFDGLPGRNEATGYGLVYFCEEMLKKSVNSLENKTVCVSGAGNVAIHAVEKSIAYGAKVVTMSDSTGWIYDKDGINLSIIKDIKEKKKLRILEYNKIKSDSQYFEGKFDWSIPCDVAMPCATQNEILLDFAKNLVKNKCIAVVEGANMPTTLEATRYLVENKVLFAPGKAANAGGVSASGLEMSQNSNKSRWEFQDVDVKLKAIMKNIFVNISQRAEEFSRKHDYIFGANIHSFIEVTNSMIKQGI
ncbi:MAG: NADP-specific glutamate dehydrogenase [Candidatus Improbicoccus devescovinae]|nr:MAG: NADP-specific glutamate dehydrogenase [Candidatus Improbicoccus devescovinae]